MRTLNGEDTQVWDSSSSSHGVIVLKVVLLDVFIYSGYTSVALKYHNL